MPCYFAPNAHTLEIICLEPGEVAPEGAVWIELGPVIGGGWSLDGNVPVPRNILSAYGSYPDQSAALAEALNFAMQQECPLLYVEIDARRCD